MRKHKGLRVLVGVLIVLAMTVWIATPAFAATTATVDVTATPSYISITDNATSFDFGVVTVSTIGNTSETLIEITNASTVVIDCTIGTNSTIWCANGLSWSVNGNGTASDNGAGLYAYSNSTLPAEGVIVNNTGTNQIASDLDGEEPFHYGLQLNVPSVFSDGTQKSVKIIVTAAAG